jgi:hypothetical protein
MEPGGEDAEKKKSKIKRAWGYYRWYDRISGWNDWYNWLSSFLKTKTGAAVAIGSTAAVTTATAVVVHNALQAPPPPPPAPVEVAAPAPPPPPASEPVRQTQGTLIYAIEGKDKAGRKGTFDVVVAKKEFLWVRKSSEEIEKDGKAIPGADIANQVLDDDVKAALGTAREIIAVGTASQEGDAKEETERAGKRAKKTAEIVVSGVAPTVPIWTLNLGQYHEPGKDSEASGTNWQRPFIVIAVKDLEVDSNVGEALADALAGQKKLPAPQSYSAFELTKFR